MGQPFDVWGQRGRYDGEVYRSGGFLIALRRVMTEHLGSAWPSQISDLTTVARLVPERRREVRVLIDGRSVGDLADGDRYYKVLTHLIETGLSPQVSVRVGGRYDADGHLDGSVELDLAEPHLLVPANPAPKEAHVLLPQGEPIPVVGTRPDAERLRQLVGVTGVSWVHATLDEAAESGAVEVRIDGLDVGRVTPAASVDLLPTVREFAEQGVVAARAMLIGGAKGVDITLYAGRTSERELAATLTIHNEPTLSQPGRHRRDR